MRDIENLLKKTKSLKLLYVEDNKDTRESTLFILEDLFDDIIVAVDGKDGLDKFKKNKIDIVITDINMPNGDGLKMSRDIKDLNYNLPIIIITAITDISILKDAIDIGIDSFINKPLLDIEFLFTKLEHVVNRLKYNKDEKALEDINTYVHIIQNIAHHWRQPLSVISSISSGWTVKIDHNMKLTKEDLDSAEIITQKAEELSKVLLKIEHLDLNNIQLPEIKRLIEISNPLYDKKK